MRALTAKNPFSSTTCVYHVCLMQSNKIKRNRRRGDGKAMNESESCELLIMIVIYVTLHTVERELHENRPICVCKD